MQNAVAQPSPPDPEPTLRGRRVLVVEDEYFIADDLLRALQALGAEVAGPVPTAGEALGVLGQPGAIDAAVLDINLRGESIYAVADALVARGIPFVFATGYEAGALPPRFRDVPRCQKPFNVETVARAVAELRRAA